MEGEEIELRQTKLYINGVEFIEPYLESSLNSTVVTSKNISIKIPKGHYFVLGDNRVASSDSRSFGTVPYELIYAKVLWRYWP